jgi:putative ABC transport system permease protein
MSSRAAWSELRAVTAGAWRDHPGRLLLSILGVAFGVGLGVAVHLINSSALTEFTRAVRTLSGEADIVIRGARAGFEDPLYPRIARRSDVLAASPALEVDAQVAGHSDTLKVLGIDPFRAAQVQPHLLEGSREALLDLVQNGAVLLSRSAADALQLRSGESLRLQTGSHILVLRIAAVLPAAVTRQRLAIMDIAHAQWQFGRVGALNRVDVKLAPGVSPEAFEKTIAAELPAGVIAAPPEREAARNAALSRAYRTNLDMLALVALFTGAFLVFSTQFLALTRRRTQLALLRVLGVTRPRLIRLLLFEGAAIGVAGAAIGLAIGYALARIGIERLGGDLGAGYFSGVTPELHIDGNVLAVFFALGIGFAIAGVAFPALQAARRPPALALRAGDEEDALRSFTRWWPGAIIACFALLLSQAPAVGELPIAAYVAIALLLLGAIWMMPRFAEIALERLPRSRYPPAALAAAQLQGTPRQVGVSLAAILVSFSLMVSMLVMIGSFRESLSAWLGQMLPADLYVRAGRAGEAAYFTPDEQRRIERVDGVREATFLRAQNIFMRSDRAPIALLARMFPSGQHTPALPFEGPTYVPAKGEPPPIWISEIAADLLHLRTGMRIELPIGGARHAFTVAGIWRDYARQNGAIVMERSLYVHLTGDERVNEAALFLNDGVQAESVTRSIRRALDNPENLEIVTTQELKELSLSIFDRTFAVTYALELAAVLIGMFGVSASFSAQVLARAREFGVLRHIGMTRREIATMLACEGAIVASLGVIVGLALGSIISLILVHVVNRQSFHWSMDMHVPWADLAMLALTLIAASAFTAALSGRRATTGEVTRAVREDW